MRAKFIAYMSQVTLMSMLWFPTNVLSNRTSQIDQALHHQPILPCRCGYGPRSSGLEMYRSLCTCRAGSAKRVSHTLMARLVIFFSVLSSCRMRLSGATVMIFTLMSYSRLQKHSLASGKL